METGATTIILSDTETDLLYHVWHAVCYVCFSVML